MLKDADTVRKHLNFVTTCSVLYLLIGLGVCISLFSSQDLKFFVLGALFSLINFEFFKRGALMLLPILTSTNTQNVNPVVLILVVGKIMFVGLGIAFLILSNTFLVIPFVIGMLCILFSSLVLGVQIGVKEFIYART